MWQLGIRSYGEDSSWGGVGKRWHLRSYWEMEQIEKGVGEEISWGAVEMRLHLGSFREIGIDRGRECGGGNQLGSSGDEVAFGEFWGNWGS
jgi:hypothetical protein